ncbi:MAG: hypothetical protein U0892_01340 [Pirellulales bacterium]
MTTLLMLWLAQENNLSLQLLLEFTGSELSSSIHQHQKSGASVYDPK